MLPYFPFTGEVYRMTLGAQALNPDRLLEIDPANYRDEIGLKAGILADDHPYYFKALPQTEAFQWEVLEFLLANLATHYPEHFSLEIAGNNRRWQNRLLDLDQTFTSGDSSTLALAPLDWLGRQVQEDLLVLDGNDPAIPLVAGQLCFASGWCLDDKIGKSFLEIHDPVPLFADQIGQPSQLMMARLKADRPVGRVNWGVKSSSQLNQATRFLPELAGTYRGINPENAGERCFFRVERQVLARLPQTNGVLFTIHTYQVLLKEIAANPEQRRYLLGVLKTAPPELLQYKGMLPYTPALVGYLETAV
jgi:dimethylamine monooxygenase subunit A